MATWTASTTIGSDPDRVIEILTDPSAASRWAPIDFEVDDLDGDRLEAGGHARLVGRLAGREVAFDVDVFEAGAGRLSLTARGPVVMDVEYELEPAGRDSSDVRAQITVRNAGGLRGRLISSATDGLLAAGSLDSALAAIRRELEAPDYALAA